MTKIRASSFFILVLPALAGCGRVGTDGDVNDLKQSSIALIGKHAVDPTSVLVDNVRQPRVDLICGRTNLKARTGAFVGWTRFVGSSSDGTLSLDESANPAVRDAIQDIQPEIAFHRLYNANCETAAERKSRISAEAEQAAAQLKQKQEQAAEAAQDQREQRVAELRRWASGEWLTVGHIDLCSNEFSKRYFADGTFTIGTPGNVTSGTWSIDENGRVSERDPRFPPSYSVWKRVSDTVASITREGQTKRFERCPS